MDSYIRILRSQGIILKLDCQSGGCLHCSDGRPAKAVTSLMLLTSVQRLDLSGVLECSHHSGLRGQIYAKG